jgi:hypothetical protein
MIPNLRKKPQYIKYIPPTSSQQTDISDRIYICNISGQIDISCQRIDISLNNILEEISEYANKIYTDLHVPETVINTKEDYIKLFIVACKIVKQAKDVTLSIDYSIFGDFGNVADKLHDIFQNYIFRIKSMQDIEKNADFLKSIASSLKKIWNIKETFSKFKEAILSLTLDTIMNDDLVIKATSSIHEMEIIENSIKKIQNWNNLYTTGMKIELSNKPPTFVKETCFSG